MAIDPNLTRVYPNVTPEKFANFRAQAAARDITLPDGNSGQVSQFGFVLNYSYDGTANLTLTIVSKPFFLSADFLWRQLQPFIS